MEPIAQWVERIQLHFRNLPYGPMENGLSSLKGAVESSILSRLHMPDVVQLAERDAIPITCPTGRMDVAYHCG